MRWSLFLMAAACAQDSPAILLEELAGRELRVEDEHAWASQPGSRSSALKAVQRVAAKRFPGLALPDSLATLTEDELFEIMDQIYTVRDRKAATAALRGVSRRA